MKKCFHTIFDVHLCHFEKGSSTNGKTLRIKYSASPISEADTVKCRKHNDLLNAYIPTICNWDHRSLCVVHFFKILQNIDMIGDHSQRQCLHWRWSEEMSPAFWSACETDVTSHVYPMGQSPDCSPVLLPANASLLYCRR